MSTLQFIIFLGETQAGGRDYGLRGRTGFSSEHTGCDQFTSRWKGKGDTAAECGGKLLEISQESTSRNGQTIRISAEI